MRMHQPKSRGVCMIPACIVIRDDKPGSKEAKRWWWGRTQVTAAERSADRTGPVTDHASYEVAL